MIFDCTRVARLTELADKQFSAPFVLAGGGLWVGVLSSGRCALSGEAQRLAAAGGLCWGPGLCAWCPPSPAIWWPRASGAAPRHTVFCRVSPGPCLPAGPPRPARPASCPTGGGAAPAQAGSLCFQLLCGRPRPPRRPPCRRLWPRPSPPCAKHYAGLYGSRLSASLSQQKAIWCGCSKRRWASTGAVPHRGARRGGKAAAVPPGISLEVVASLCGFPAQIICARCSKGHQADPAAWRSGHRPPRCPPPLPLEQGCMYKPPSAGQA